MLLFKGVEYYISIPSKPEYVHRARLHISAFFKIHVSLPHSLYALSVPNPCQKVNSLVIRIRHKKKVSDNGHSVHFRTLLRYCFRIVFSAASGGRQLPARSRMASCSSYTDSSDGCRNAAIWSAWSLHPLQYKSCIVPELSCFSSSGK